MTRRQIVKAGVAAAAFSAVGASGAAAKEKTEKPMESLAALKAKLDQIGDDFKGTLGYSLHHRTRSEAIDRNGDEPFPTASTIKTAILCAIMRAVEAGTIKWTAPITVQPGMDRREEGGPAYYFKDGSAPNLPVWLDLMIDFSDNTATINLRDLVGMGNVNLWLADHGFKTTKLLNGPDKAALGLLPLQQKYGLGMTTPKEMGRLFEMIRDGKAGSAASCDRMLRLLTHQYWDNDIASQIPPTIQIGHKSGAVDQSRSDAAYIFAPSGEIALTVYTKDQEDQRWEQDNAGDDAIRKIAALVWKHYHPHDPWTPPPGAEGLMP